MGKTLLGLWFLVMRLMETLGYENYETEFLSVDFRLSHGISIFLVLTKLKGSLFLVCRNVLIEFFLYFSPQVIIVDARM